MNIEQKLGMVPVMTVHDELVYEIDCPEQGKAIQTLVNTAPSWAPGLPIASAQHVGFRYGKGAG